MGKIYPAVIFIFGFLASANGIRCFQCGTEAIFSDDTLSPNVENTVVAMESCANLESSYSSWGMYSVDCAPGQICMKTIIDDSNGLEYKRHSYITSTRGCAMRNTSFGKIHQMGCGILKTNLVPSSELQPSRYHLSCFCEEDYCNAACGVELGIGVSVLIGIFVVIQFF